MGYYRATLEDFKVGRVFEERGLQMDWVTTVLTAGHFDLYMGHNQFMEILLNLHRFRNHKPYYRIKWLDAQDIEMFGFKLNTENIGNTKNQKDTVEYKLREYTLTHNPDSKSVKIMADNDTPEGIHMETLFNGKVLDYNELKTLLEQLGIIISQDRHFKINNTIKNFELYNG